MKTTVELPEDVLQQLKLRAVREGRRLAEVVAELLRAGLGITKDTTHRKPDVGELPVVDCDPARLGQEMTPNRVAEALWGTPID